VTSPLSSLSSLSQPLTPMIRQIFSAIALSTTLTLYLISPTLAQDPFRATNQRPIGEKTEAAFRAMFEQGDYISADRYLKAISGNEQQEPLAYAMRASLAYVLNEDYNSLGNYGKKTLDTARQLTSTDPLRGNLYSAVGHFLLGASALFREGTVKGTPQALAELRQVYEYMDKAEAISSTDPELNLLRGYMDLMVSVNLPFFNPEQAIGRLQRFAGPKYLSERGVAVGYRDLKKFPQAIEAVDRAMKASNSNPELYYLKGQILSTYGNQQKSAAMLQESVKNFDLAIAKKDQLPPDLVKQIERERRKAAQRLSVVAQQK
jgi:tetratricopeptide (TPR) repeat protein